MRRPVIYCPFCEAAYELPTYTDGTHVYYDLDEAKLIADDHIYSHTKDLVIELGEYLAKA
jgi:hypothetical protein